MPHFHVQCNKLLFHIQSSHLNWTPRGSYMNFLFLDTLCHGRWHDLWSFCRKPRWSELGWTLNGESRILLSFGHFNFSRNRKQTAENKQWKKTNSVPKKDIILVLPFLGFQSEALTRRVKSCISNFYGFVNLRVIFQNTCRVKSFFPYKDHFSRSQRSKIVYKASCWDCDSFYSTSAKQKEDCMTGSPSISKLLHKSAMPLPLQTILFLPVITSNGTILKSSQLESPTCSVKLKKCS